MFREDSVTSKFLHGVLYAKGNCNEFLYNAIYPTLLEVKSLKFSVEVGLNSNIFLNIILLKYFLLNKQLNPAKLEGTQTLDKMLETLTTLLDNLLNNISNAVAQCPM